jgi:hypothetical protein
MFTHAARDMLFMKGYTVFTVEPIDGLPAPDDAPARDVRRLPPCEAFMVSARRRDSLSVRPRPPAAHIRRQSEMSSVPSHAGHARNAISTTRRSSSRLAPPAA